MSSTDAPYERYRDHLTAEGLIVPSPVDGVYGKGEDFMRVYDGLVALVVAAGSAAGPERFRFPGVFPRQHFLRTDYLRSFPNLIGSVHSFEGDDAAHADLLQTVDGGGEWASGLPGTDLVLLPAACYPLYPMAAGQLPEGGRLFEVLGTCFRHEPSIDPARLQTFHQLEFVHLGTPESAVAFRDHWLDRSLELLSDLGLRVRPEVATDVFFGRVGRMLAANQRASELKFEVMATVADAERPTAITSCNCHQDHLTEAFEITTADGERAHSACIGFGLERIVLALVAQHGPDLAAWPSDVRSRLWP